MLAITCSLSAFAAVTLIISPAFKIRSLVKSSVVVFAAIDLTLNKVNAWEVTDPAPFSPSPVKVIVIVDALPESFATIIEFITDWLKSALVGAVYNVSSSVVVKSILAFVKPWTYCGMLTTNLIFFHIVQYWLEETLI